MAGPYTLRPELHRTAKVRSIHPQDRPFTARRDLDIQSADLADRCNKECCRLSAYVVIGLLNNLRICSA